MSGKSKGLGFLMLLLMIALTLLACGEGSEHISHYQGDVCLNCHNFTVSGTVFTLINETGGSEANAANSFTVRLKSASGLLIASAGTARGYGNFAWNGSVTEGFLPEVVAPNGSVVNRAATVHLASSVSCNSCHTSAGTTTTAGGAPAPGRIVNYNWYNQLL